MVGLCLMADRSKKACKHASKHMHAYVHACMHACLSAQNRSKTAISFSSTNDHSTRQLSKLHRHRNSKALHLSAAPVSSIIPRLSGGLGCPLHVRFNNNLTSADRQTDAHPDAEVTPDVDSRRKLKSQRLAMLASISAARGGRHVPPPHHRQNKSDPGHRDSDRHSGHRPR